MAVLARESFLFSKALVSRVGIVGALAIALALVGATRAQADVIDFSLTGADVASFEITETAGIVTAITGTFDGASILNLVSAYAFDNNDNAYSTSQPYFDIAGVSFTLSSPDTNGFDLINIYSDYLNGNCSAGSDPTTFCSDQALSSSPDVITFGYGADTLTQTPEPGTVCLILPGLLSLFIAGSRKQK